MGISLVFSKLIETFSGVFCFKIDTLSEILFIETNNLVEKQRDNVSL